MTLTFEHVTLKINRDHLLIEGNPCTKFGIDQVKGSKDIERTTQWAQKSGLTLTFEHVTLKINRDHLPIEGNPCTKFGIDELKGSKDIERTTHGVQTDRPTDRPTDSCKTKSPLFQGGHKKITNICYVPHPQMKYRFNLCLIVIDHYNFEY